MRLLAYPHIRLIYNGEIYNCREVQKEYGFNYESHCDGEAIIHLYVRLGAEKAAEMLDGVFAFVIVDTNERKVFLARDIFGIRPMFTFLDKGKGVQTYVTTLCQVFLFINALAIDPHSKLALLFLQVHWPYALKSKDCWNYLGLMV